MSVKTIDEKHTLCGCSMADYLEREEVSGYQMTQVSQKLRKAWVIAFMYMSLMGQCREFKPVSAAVQTALQI